MHAERYTRKRFWLASWLFVLSAISYLDRTNVSIAGLQISSEYGLGNQRLGWIFSAFLIGYAGFQVPAGWLASRFGPRLVISLGVLWWGVATGLTTMIPRGIPQAVLLLIAIRLSLQAGTLTVNGLAPLSELDGYAARLKAMTAGHAGWTMTLSHYDPAPVDLQQQLAADYAKHRRHEEE